MKNKILSKENIPEKIMKTLKKFYSKERRTTLNRMRKKPNAFKILISCLLSLRTKDETTEKIVKKLFSLVSKPEELAKVPLKKLEKIIYSSGYYRNKAKTIKNVAKVIINKYKGKVPSTKEELLSIKGVGPKTANIVLGFAFNKLVIPVDTNVHRIANRLGLIKTKTPEKTIVALEKVMPKKYWKELNSLFVLHGKKICVPVSPKCSVCPLDEYCKKVGVTKKR